MKQPGRDNTLSHFNLAASFIKTLVSIIFIMFDSNKYLLFFSAVFDPSFLQRTYYISTTAISEQKAEALSPRIPSLSLLAAGSSIARAIKSPPSSASLDGPSYHG